MLMFGLFFILCRCIVGLLFKKKGNPHSMKSPHNKNELRQKFLQAVFTVGTIVVALAACLYWDEFDINGPHWMKKFPKKFSYAFNTFKKFYGKHTYLVGQYKKSVCQMFADSIS